MSEVHAPVTTDRYTLVHGDCVHAMSAMPDASVALTVTSIPFADLFAYTRDQADLGNNRGDSFWYGFRCVAEQLRRVMKPGRVVAIHTTQLLAYKNLHGFVGIRDFTGDVAKVMTDAGFGYCADIAIAKNPQSIAQRMHLHSLMFTNLKKDAAQLHPARNDYVLIFKAPGDNEAPVLSYKRGELSQDDWIKWACGTWNDISEGDVLRTRGTGAEDDTKHVCPLQLEVIRRCALLWSNPDELVMDPFNGIGSTTVTAVKHGRRALGVDLKAEHHLTATANMRALDRSLAMSRAQQSLFGA
jgi:DNA modification methylase